MIRAKRGDLAFTKEDIESFEADAHDITTRLRALPEGKIPSAIEAGRCPLYEEPLDRLEWVDDDPLPPEGVCRKDRVSFRAEPHDGHQNGVMISWALWMEHWETVD